MLEALLKLHILPPVEPLNAVWTTPFFVDGEYLETLEGRHLAVSTKPDAVVISNGGKNKAHLLAGDKETCKGYIHLVDGLLKPEHKGIKDPPLPEHGLFDNFFISDVQQGPLLVDGLPPLPAWATQLGPFGPQDTINPVAQPQHEIRKPTPARPAPDGATEARTGSIAFPEPTTSTLFQPGFSDAEPGQATGRISDVRPEDQGIIRVPAPVRPQPSNPTPDFPSNVGFGQPASTGFDDGFTDVAPQEPPAGEGFLSFLFG